MTLFPWARLKSLFVNIEHLNVVILCTCFPAVTLFSHSVDPPPHAFTPSFVLSWLITVHVVCCCCRFSHHMVPGPPGPHATGIPHPAIVNPQVKHEPPHETDIMHMWVVQTHKAFIRLTLIFFSKLRPPPLYQQFFWDDILPGICALHHYNRP